MSFIEGYINTRISIRYWVKRLRESFAMIGTLPLDEQDQLAKFPTIIRKLGERYRINNPSTDLSHLLQELANKIPTPTTPLDQLPQYLPDMVHYQPHLAEAYLSKYTGDELFSEYKNVAMLAIQFHHNQLAERCILELKNAPVLPSNLLVPWRQETKQLPFQKVAKVLLVPAVKYGNRYIQDLLMGGASWEWTSEIAYAIGYSGDQELYDKYVQSGTAKYISNVIDGSIAHDQLDFYVTNLHEPERKRRDIDRAIRYDAAKILRWLLEIYPDFDISVLFEPEYPYDDQYHTIQDILGRYSKEIIELVFGRLGTSFS